jgi:hypothetical protein
MPGALPPLRTGAIAQYPLERSLAIAVEPVEFLNFTRQVYRDLGAAKRRWVIRLDLLDEGEIARLKEFFEQQKGRWGTFSFTDPWDASFHATCSFADDVFPHAESGARHQAHLAVYEHE